MFIFLSSLPSTPSMVLFTAGKRRHAGANIETGPCSCCEVASIGHIEIYSPVHLFSSVPPCSFVSASCGHTLTHTLSLSHSLTFSLSLSPSFSLHPSLSLVLLHWSIQGCLVGVFPMTPSMLQHAHTLFSRSVLLNPSTSAPIFAAHIAASLRDDPAEHSIVHVSQGTTRLSFPFVFVFVFPI